jgi:hypothetical protein
MCVKNSGKTEIEEGEAKAEVQYVRKADREIRQLAADLQAGAVFGSWMIHEYDLPLMGSVFMPLIFLNDIQKKTLKRDGITHFYGYMRDAGPRAINGMPMFYSIQYLNAEDCKRLTASLKALRAFIEGEE